MLFGLGASTWVSALTVEWPSGRRDVFKDVPLEHRVRIEEGRALQAEAYTPIPPLAADETPPRPGPSPLRSWLFEPFPVPDLALRDLQGDDRSLSRLRGRPAVVLVFSAAVAESRQALVALARGAADLAGAGVGAVAISLDGSAALEQVRSVAASFTGPLPVCLAGDDVVLALAILHRHLFMSRPALPLPTRLLLDRQGQVVRVYRDLVDAAAILEDTSRMDAAPPERLARALPFTGVLGSAPSRRDYVPYGRELLDQGLDAAAASAFEQAALGSPTASVLYRLGGLLAKDGQSGKARAAYERALALQPDLSEASNDLGTLLAESGDLPAAIERFRAALDAAPDYPDALNNLGYALLLTGRGPEAQELYEKALKIQPDFPEAANNLGLILGRQGALDRAEPYFRKALQSRPGYGEAANNLALVLLNRGQGEEAIRLLDGFLAGNPASESTYLTLAKIYLAAERRSEGLQTIDRLLQRNPAHAQALELKRQFE